MVGGPSGYLIYYVGRVAFDDIITSICGGGRGGREEVREGGSKGGREGRQRGRLTWSHPWGQLVHLTSLQLL